MGNTGKGAAVAKEGDVDSRRVVANANSKVGREHRVCVCDGQDERKK